MEYARLVQKKESLLAARSSIAPEVLRSFDRSFDIEYAHNSTAIEGNTLSLLQTKTLLEDGISVAANPCARFTKLRTMRRRSRT